MVDGGEKEEKESRELGGLGKKSFYPGHRGTTFLFFFFFPFALEFFWHSKFRGSLFDTSLVSRGRHWAPSS